MIIDRISTFKYHEMIKNKKDLLFTCFYETFFITIIITNIYIYSDLPILKLASDFKIYNNLLDIPIFLVINSALNVVVPALLFSFLKASYNLSRYRRQIT